MKNFLLGLLLMAAGGAMMYWSYQIADFFGRSEWAEKYLGSTRNLILVLGFVLIIVGGLVMFGVVQMGEVTGDPVGEFA